MESNPMLVEIWSIQAERTHEAAEVAGLKFGKDLIVEFGKT
jgi:hypothetical protein